MSSCYHHFLHLSIFGQSHADAIGMTLDNLPAGFLIDMEQLGAFLARRAPGNSAFATARKEADLPEFLCGLKDGRTCGAPLTAIIRNENTRSADYAAMRTIPRPGHADFTAEVKYGGFQDADGGGHFSGRLTAPLCIAGGICLQMLQQLDIRVFARIDEIAGIRDESSFLTDVSEKPFPVSDDAIGEKMQAAILAAKRDGDSVGGVIACVATGIPVGLGEPMFGGMENRLAELLFAIPAIKGVEFGDGFAASCLRGSENNDAFYAENGQIKTKTNHAGGILGGITNGMPLRFRVAIKPTPSIAKEQDSVEMTSMQDTKLCVQGRHDPCIVPRAVACVEAAAAIGILDAYLQQRGLEGLKWN